MQANAMLHGIMPQRILKLEFVADDEKHSESKVKSWTKLLILLS
jgi:hypothetical protein